MFPDDDTSSPILSVRDLSVIHRGRGSRSTDLLAVDHVSMDLPYGKTLGLVGESGSGKSTLARAVAGIQAISGGSVHLSGKCVLDSARSDRRSIVRETRMVFQDPFSSLNPRMRIGDSIAEALRQESKMTRREKELRSRELLALVRMDPDVISRYPHQFSGGQLQRVAIARALAGAPRLLIADEITSALDVSVQAGILNLLRRLQSEMGFAVLFISHNLAVVRYVSDSVAVMYRGQIVESGTAASIFQSPEHSYTKKLLEAIPGTASTRPTPTDLD